MKQASLSKWMEQGRKKLKKAPSSSSGPLRITLNIDSTPQYFEDLIAEIEGKQIVLYLKRKQIPIYIGKISKAQFLGLSNLGDNLSPATIKHILPELDDGLVLDLCQFLLAQRSKQRREQTDNLFIF
ncbi:MAG: hypothetical protein ACTSQI_08105 [Candidatus Helarchaeota archaeon]